MEELEEEGNLPEHDYDLDIRVIDWKSKLTEVSLDKLRSITPVEIETQQWLREKVNFGITDVIYFQGKMYRDEILKDALNDLKREYNDIVEETKKGNKNFKGKVCLIGHSLGSVVCYNLLRENQRPDFQIPFDVDELFLWGSPVGLFISGNSEYMEKMPRVKNNRFYNVFHPMDPVAYRVEPTIEGHEASKKRILPLEVPYHRNDGVAPATLFKDWLEGTWDNIFKTDLCDDFDRRHLTGEIDIDEVDENELRYDFSLQEALIEEFGGPLWWNKTHGIYYTSKDTVKFLVDRIAEES